MIRFTCLLIPGLLLGLCQAHAYDVLCRNGNTDFSANFFTGVQVNVGPPTRGELATRICRATLSWEDQEIVVAGRAAEIDLDLFGADLGVGAPVAAFQVKDAEAACCMTYKIYSLEKPPRLLRTLQGGNYYAAKDSNLDGRVEIWTDDAAAVNGLEGVRASQLPFPPTLVLRFEDGRLLDVSSEFQPYFDQVIAKIRGQMNLQQLQKFKQGGREADRRANNSAGASSLSSVKQQILELVWAYQYSNREQQAWKTLAEMWPAADVERIRAELSRARARGLRAQLDGVSDVPPPMEEQPVRIYDSTSKPARPIMVRYYPSEGTASLQGKLRVSLVVDSAGKVWSVKVSGKNKAAYESVRRSTANWKFIPAYAGDQPVASRVKMTISLKQ